MAQAGRLGAKGLPKVQEHTLGHGEESCEAIAQVMSCDVGRFLPLGDSPVAEVEHIIHLQMRAFTPNPPRTRRRGRSGRGGGRSLVPRGRIELLVQTASFQILHLLAYRDRAGEFYVELHDGDVKLRSFNTHDLHENPDAERTPVPGAHVHFPSEQFPLLYRSGEYAYPVETPGFSDSTDSVLFFCSHLNIELDSMQFQLAYGGGR